MKKLGLRLIFWIATVLMNGSLSDQEKDDLKSLQTKLNIIDMEDES